MAKSAKAGTGSSKKKKSKGKKKAKVLDALVKGIGVISTIDIPQEFRDAFERGVNDATVLIKYRHAATYKTAKLAKKVRRFNKDADIGLIVTVGGLKAYDAAAQFIIAKPFVSLVGVAPTNASAKCRGGVTLNSVQYNSNRVNYLTTKLGCSAIEIGLLQNPNSTMQAAEVDNWANSIGAGAITPAGNDTGVDENDSATYQDAFLSISGGIKGLVVSSDPFFQDTKDELVDEANKWGKYVCYPSQAFGRARPRPKAGLATLLGPDLVAAYQSLGARAKSVLDTNANLTPLFEPAVQITTEIT